MSLYIIGTLSLKNHFIQDRLLDIAIKSIAIPESNLPEDDALTAIVCGSRAPINDPARAEACILVQAGQDIYIFDTGGGSIANLNNWNIPWDRVNTIFYTHLHSDHVFDIADSIKQPGLMVQEILNKKYMGLKEYKCLLMELS